MSDTLPFLMHTPEANVGVIGIEARQVGTMDVRRSPGERRISCDRIGPVIMLWTIPKRLRAARERVSRDGRDVLRRELTLGAGADALIDARTANARCLTAEASGCRAQGSTNLYRSA